MSEDETFGERVEIRGGRLLDLEVTWHFEIQLTWNFFSSLSNLVGIFLFNSFQRFVTHFST